MIPIPNHAAQIKVDAAIMQEREGLINRGLATRSDVQKAVLSITEYRFTTVDGQLIVVAADDKFKVILGSYPSYSPRSGLIFKVDSGRETDESLVVDVISRELRTILGRATAIRGKKVVESCGQTSLDSDQMMTTITVALKQEAGITREEVKKVSRMRRFMSRLGFKSTPSSEASRITDYNSAAKTGTASVI